MTETNGKTIVSSGLQIMLQAGLAGVLAVVLIVNMVLGHIREVEENRDQQELFNRIASASEAQAKAMESIAEDSKQEVEEVKRLNRLFEELLKR